MKNKLFTLGFGVSLFLDLIALVVFGFLIYSSINFTFEDYQSKFQFLTLIVIILSIANIKNVYSDCTKNNKNKPLLRAIVYGLTGPLGWQIYYSEYYSQKAKDGYFEYEDDKESNVVSPVSKPVAYLVILGVILFILFASYFTFLRDRARGDYMESLLLLVFLLSIIIYTIFSKKSLKENKKNPLDKDAGKLASFLVLIFFVAAIAFIFYYAKYLVK